jgi:hypothetical protein
LSTKRNDPKRERSHGAGRPFKHDIQNRFLMLLVYYHLYITYTLAGSLFDLESNACTKTYKKLNIEYGKTMITNFPEDIQHYKKIENATEEVEPYFSSFLAFIEIQNSSIF